MSLLQRCCAPKLPRLEPWPFVALAVLLGGCSRSPEARPAVEARPPDAVTAIPEWGKLERVKITIERPLAIISATPQRYPPPHDWFFGGTNVAAIQSLLAGAGITEPVTNEARWLITPAGIRVPVDSEFIFELSDQARQTLYPVLAQFPENKPQNDFSAFPSPELDEWFEDTGLSPQTIGWVTNRFYRQGGLVCFADLGVVLTRIDSPIERLHLVKTLSRETTMLLKLRVDEKTDVDALVQYWGWPGRGKSFEPLLESLKRVPGGSAIDVVHLLPPFARQRLYTYPHARTNAADGVQDCYWTAFNFFADTPVFRYGNTAEIKVAVEQDYQRVRDRPRMGDLMMLVNEQGMAVHAANYIADDVVFTKNGEANIRPWLLMDLEDLLAIYTTSAKPRVVLYRRKDFD